MKKTIVILHGWGRHITGNTYSELKKLLDKKGFDVLTPDLPGFGTNSQLKKTELEFDDYIEFVHEYVSSIIQKNKTPIVLLGHSFGGRIAIKFSALYPKLVDSLILTGASGIPRPLPSLKKRIVYTATKIIRPLFLIPPFSLFFKLFRKIVYYSIGELDYYKAGPLAQTFKNVYKVDISKDLEKIKAPTLIVWGEEDTITPLDDGKFMYSHIPNAQLNIVKEEGHKLPYNAPEKLSDAVSKFLS